MVVVASSISFPISLIVACYWMADKSRRSSYLLLSLFLCVSPINALLYLFPVVTEPDQQRRFCINNAVQRQQSDGPSVCVAGGMMIEYVSLLGSFLWVAQAEICFSESSGKWACRFSWDSYLYAQQSS
jgi:hypothetical protein